MEEYVQPRILKAIISKGGEATTREIADISGMGIRSVSRGGDYLKAFGIINRRVRKFIDKRNIPRKICVYTLSPGREYTVNKMLAKIPEGWEKI